MLSKLTIHLSLLLLTTVLLSACGFHLRKGLDLPENMQSTALQGVAEFSDLGLAFKRNFNHSGITLIEPESALTILKVNKNRFSRRVLSVDSAGDPNEYELTYQLSVVVVDKSNKELIPPQSIRSFRSYRYNSNARLAKDAEENNLKKNMLSEAVRQVMRRVSTAMKNLE